MLYGTQKSGVMGTEIPYRSSAYEMLLETHIKLYVIKGSKIL